MKKIAVSIFALALLFGECWLGDWNLGVAHADPVAHEWVNIGGNQYETVAASQTAQVLGATGAAGDYLDGVIIIPALAAGGVVTLLDGATSIPLYVGGATTAAADVMPVYIHVGARSVSGAWKVTTGASISVIAVGRFS